VSCVERLSLSQRVIYQRSHWILHSLSVDDGGCRGGVLAVAVCEDCGDEALDEVGGTEVTAGVGGGTTDGSVEVCVVVGK